MKILSKEDSLQMLGFEERTGQGKTLTLTLTIPIGKPSCIINYNGSEVVR